MRNPLSIEAFADWAEKQPADEKYNYTDDTGCAFCQYLGFLGKRASVGAATWWDRDDPHRQQRYLPSGINSAVVEEPWTFGALASRLRALS